MKGNKIVYITRADVKVEVVKGYENLVFHNQFEGLHAIKEEPIIMVIDLGLRGVTGYDLISMVRSNPANHHIKIIMCSKKYNHSLIKKCFDIGADFYISIPFDANEILFIINDIKQHYYKFLLDYQEEIFNINQPSSLPELTEQKTF